MGNSKCGILNLVTAQQGLTNQGYISAMYASWERREVRQTTISTCSWHSYQAQCHHGIQWIPEQLRSSLPLNAQFWVFLLSVGWAEGHLLSVQHSSEGG